jgi:hypothetical protein
MLPGCKCTHMLGSNPPKLRFELRVSCEVGMAYGLRLHEDRQGGCDSTTKPGERGTKENR